MKFIAKQTPPTIFLQYIKNNPTATYSMFRKGKRRYKETKQSLLEEQGYICCYCGRRIDYEGSQIEHIFSKGTAAYKKLQLDYETNMVACCDGGKKERSEGTINKEYLYCEAVKGDKILPINPLTIECERKFLFDENGDIIGVSKDAEVTIEMLNLTSPVITNKRKAAIKYYIDYPVSDWDAEYMRLSKKDALGRFEEFCFVLQRYIEIFHGKELKTAVCI